MEFFGATGPDPLRPSLFELIAQEQLRDVLQPALKYVLVARMFHYPWIQTLSQFYRFLLRDIRDT